jgi:hypothetical protein
MPKRFAIIVSALWAACAGVSMGRGDWIGVAICGALSGYLLRQALRRPPP